MLQRDGTFVKVGDSPTHLIDVVEFHGRCRGRGGPQSPLVILSYLLHFVPTHYP